MRARERERPTHLELGVRRGHKQPVVERWWSLGRKGELDDVPPALVAPPFLPPPSLPDSVLDRRWVGKGDGRLSSLLLLLLLLIRKRGNYC